MVGCPPQQTKSLSVEIRQTPKPAPHPPAQPAAPLVRVNLIQTCGESMKLKELLNQYPEEALDQIARDNVDAIANVRLPRSVLEREIAATLSSFSYVAETMAASHPPTYVFIKLIMESPEHSVAAYGFKEAVLHRTDKFTEQAASQSASKAADEARHLYRSALKAAWEFDNRITASEANLLETLRTELGITMREHLLLEHHPDVRPVWDSPRAYETARNYLLAKGLILTHGNHFVLPEEVAAQIRKYWGVEMHDATYKRLLSRLTIGNLRAILETHSLALSGSKAERIDRIVTGMVSPSDALDVLTINELKDFSRSLRLPVSLAKSELISQLIAGFDQPSDQLSMPATTGADDAVTSPGRQLEEEAFHELLSRLTGSQLHEVLDGLGLARSGRKDARVARLVQSHFSEAQVLSQLRRRELSAISERLGLPISGLKDDLVERIIAAAARETEGEEDLVVVDTLSS